MSKDVEIDQKSQSSDESTVSFGKKSSKKSQEQVGQAQISRKKRSHCQVNTQDSQKSTLSKNNNSARQPMTVCEEEGIESLDDMEGILLQKLSKKGLLNKRKSKEEKKLKDKSKPMPMPLRMRKKRTHDEMLYNGVDQEVRDRNVDVDRD